MALRSTQTNVGFGGPNPTIQFGAGDVVDAIRGVGTTIGGAVVTTGQAAGNVLSEILRSGAEILRQPQVIEGLTGLVNGFIQRNAQEDIIKEQAKAQRQLRELELAEQRRINDAALELARAQVGQGFGAENPAEIAGRLQTLETSQGSVLFDPSTGTVFGSPGGGSGAGSPAPFFSDVSGQVASQGRGVNSSTLILIAAGAFLLLGGKKGK